MLSVSLGCDCHFVALMVLQCCKEAAVEERGTKSLPIGRFTEAIGVLTQCGFDE